VDLHLYARVVRRFWPLVSLGVLLAVVFAFLSFCRVDLRGGLHVALRQHETWRGTETLLLTQRGFPWGRTVYPYAVNRKTGQLLPSKSLADPSRFTDLAVVYAEVANGDAIRARVFPHGAPDGSYSASPVVNSVGSAVLGAQPITQIVPLVQVDALATTPARALSIASRASEALRTYVESSQERASIPPNQRVLLQVLSRPTKATLAHGYRMTGPIAAFVGTLVATLLLAFVLENLRPRSAARVEDETREPGSPSEPGSGVPAPVVHRNGGARLPAPPAPSPASLGELLRDARVRKGLDLRVVGVRIEVPSKYLRALEADRRDLLPDEQTARRALAAYADHLEVDIGGWLDDPPHGGRNGNGRNGKVKALTLSVPMIVAVLAAVIALLSRGGSQRPPAALAARTPAKTPAGATVTTAKQLPPPTAENARLAVTAVRGDTWLVVRAGSAQARVLYAGTLKRGDTLRRTGRRLWLELGAAANADVTVDGIQPHVRLYGTLDAIVSPHRFRKVALQG